MGFWCQFLIEDGKYIPAPARVWDGYGNNRVQCDGNEIGVPYPKPALLPSLYIAKQVKENVFLPLPYVFSSIFPFNFLSQPFFRNQI